MREDVRVGWGGVGDDRFGFRTLLDLVVLGLERNRDHMDSG